MSAMRVDQGAGERAPVGAENRRFALWLAAVAVLGLAARVTYVLVIGRHVALGFDAIWYELQAGTVATGKGYVDPDSFYRLGLLVPTANFPPLWPIVLAVAYRFGLDTEVGFQMVGALLGTVTVVVAGLLGRRVQGRRVGLAAALIVACCPMLIAADGSLMSESLYVLLVTAAVLASYRALDRPTLWRFGVVGVLVGLAALTRADALFLAPVLAAVLAWRVRAPSTARRLGLAACLLAAFVVPLVPWTVSRSSSMGGLVVMSSNSGSTLEGANCATSYRGELLGNWDATCVDPRPAGTSELDWSASGRRAALDFASAHLARLPVVGAARVLRVWGIWEPTGQARLEAIESRNERWQLLAWAYDLALLAAALPGAVLLVRRRAVVAPMVAVVLGVVLTALAVHGNQRFRLSADPVLAVAAATAAVTFGRQVWSTSMRATRPSRNR